MLDFWLNVKERLDDNDISQKELAAAINESYNTLQSWITKDRLLNAEQAVNIARILKTSVEYLVTKQDHSFKKDNSKTIALLEQAIESLR
ncbi:MAG: helix-turn-helix transcriptional regulator [Treponema sp.]|nr:helix-turn-helix domain-containing protein [Spirochaetia bacterium]MDD7274103.1 helix-turn-helix transcriptional regulator [Treponema sp.]MDY3756065.1 helix-turn-helix transcriptional regulator [Treponema sp.]